MRLTEEFLSNIAQMTDNNDHNGVMVAIADWAARNAEGVSAEMVKRFTFYRNLFREMVKINLELDNFPYGNIRYEVMKEMDSDIASTFGQDVMDTINARI